MASLIFAHAKSIYNKSNKHVDEQRDNYEKFESAGFAMDKPFDADCCRSKFIERERTKFRDILSIAQLLHEDYVEVTGAKAHNWFFITIRPKPGITFDEFYILTYKFLNRAFMLDYKLTFEQKSALGTGEGFHIHMICSTKHRSKGECLRDAKSSFAKVADENCVCVKTTRNPEEMFTKYCVEYASDDGHKAETKDGDTIWRNNLGLADVYENDLPKALGSRLLSSSSRQELSNTITIDLT